MRHCDSTRWRAWFSGEETRKGGIAPGQYGDFTLLDYDYFAVAAARIRHIESVLSVPGGHYSIPSND